MALCFTGKDGFGIRDHSHRPERWQARIYVAAGENEFARRAEGQGARPDELRGRMQKVYRERMEAQRAVLRAEKFESRDASTAEADPES